MSLRPDELTSWHLEHLHGFFFSLFLYLQLHLYSLHCFFTFSILIRGSLGGICLSSLYFLVTFNFAQAYPSVYRFSKLIAYSPNSGFSPTDWSSLIVEKRLHRNLWVFVLRPLGECPSSSSEALHLLDTLSVTLTARELFNPYDQPPVPRYVFRCKVDLLDESRMHGSLTAVTLFRQLQQVPGIMGITIATSKYSSTSTTLGRHYPKAAWQS